MVFGSDSLHPTRSLEVGVDATRQIISCASRTWTFTFFFASRLFVNQRNSQQCKARLTLLCLQAVHAILLRLVDEIDSIVPHHYSTCVEERIVTQQLTRFKLGIFCPRGP